MRIAKAVSWYCTAVCLVVSLAWPVLAELRILYPNGTIIPGLEYPCFSFPTLVYPFFVNVGLLIPLSIEPGCQPVINYGILHYLKSLDPSTLPEYAEWNATILFANMGYGQDCNHVNDLIAALGLVVDEVKDLELPPVKVVTVSFGTNSTDVAGNPDLVFYHPNESEPDPVHVMISLDSAWRDVNDAWDEWEEVAVVRVTEDRGPWNKYYDQHQELTTARFVLLGIYCIMAFYTLIQTTYLVTHFGLRKKILLTIYVLKTIAMLLYSIQPNTIYRQNQKHYLQPVSYQLNFICIDLMVIMWSRFARKMSNHACIDIIGIMAICHLVLSTITNILWVATNVASRNVLLGAFFITIAYIFPSLNVVLVIGIVLTIALIISQVKDIHLPAESIKGLRRLTYAIGVATFELISISIVAIVSNPLILTPTLDYFRVLFQYITLLIAYFSTIFFLRIKPHGVIRQSILSRASYLNQRTRDMYWRYHKVFTRFGLLSKRQVSPDTPVAKTTSDTASQSSRSSTHSY